MTSNTQSYQLFPSPVTKVKPSNNPFLQSATRPRHSQTISPIEEENAKGFGRPQSLVITVTEHTSPIKPPAAAHLNKERSQTPSPIEQSAEHASPTSTKALKSPCYPPRVSSGPQSKTVPDSPSSPRSPPALPMRSMFPQYDFNRKPDEQQYFPQRPVNPQVRREAVTRDEYSPRVVSPSFSDAFTGGPRTAPASVVDFPVDEFASPDVEISSLHDLDTLWKATNGQGPDLPVESFTLQIVRTTPVTFSVGLSQSQPFYHFKTLPTNELAITRYHPSRPKKLPILRLGIEDPARRLPPNDGLVSYIFPKLAAMLAMDQASQLAERYGLASTTKEEMEKEALTRAAAQEASRLRWNHEDGRYELFHPSVGKSWDEASRDRDQANATSPKDTPPPLPITFNQAHPNSAPTISIHSPFPTSTSPTSPASSSHLSSLPAHLRSSTIPLQDLQTFSSLPILATICLSTSPPTLHIHASRALHLLPSLYAIDSVVASLFAVALADPTVNAYLTSIPLSPPAIPSSTSRRGPASVAGSVATHATGFPGRIYTTLAEREDAERGVTPSGRSEDDTLVGNSSPDDETAPKKPWKLLSLRGKSSSSPLNSAPKNTKKSKKSKRKQITITEYDLEKYGTYQAGSREGQKLPGATRGALEVMFVLLRFVVWGLTMGVEFLAWLLVTVTRGVTSERF
ncbi:MAG: hypothetical protein Q9227_006936 [Pyrenula ochraceoflavens]